MRRSTSSSNSYIGSLYPPACSLAGAPCQPNAHKLYAEARERGPVGYDAGLNAWMVLGFEEVSWCFKQTELFSNSNFQVVDPYVIGNDPPQHTRYRRAMAGAMAFMQPVIVREFTQRWMANFAESVHCRGGFDAVHDFGCSLPEAFVAELLGLTPDETAELQALRMPDRTDLLSPQVPWTEVLRKVVAEREHRSTPGFVCNLLKAPKEERLEREAIVGLCKLLWIAGSATTSHVLPSMVLLMLRNPDTMKRLRERPELAASLASETARLEGAIVLLRKALHDFELAGYCIASGASVVLCVLAANTDPVFFADPLKVDLDRQPNRHLGFGGGAHHCLGAAMARMLMATAAGELAIRLPSLQPGTALDELEYEQSNMRALKRLPVVLA
jgi:cytochrome P450